MFVTVRLTICYSSLVSANMEISAYIHCTHDTNLRNRLYWPWHKCNKPTVWPIIVSYIKCSRYTHTIHLQVHI